MISKKQGQYSSKLLLGLSIGLLTLMVGCTNERASSNYYTYRQAQTEQSLRTGVVKAIRPVKIHTENTTGGVEIGGLVGGVLGNQLGRGKGRVLSTVAGAVAGGLAGNKIQAAKDTRDGYEITVQFTNGTKSVITQEADQPIYVGQHVDVLSGGGATRVVPHDGS